MVEVACKDKQLQINNISAQKTQRFNQRYEKTLQRVIQYDQKLIMKLQTIYKQSPVENYIIRALLSSTMPLSEFSDISYKSKTPEIKLNSITELCEQKSYNHLIKQERRFLSRL